MALTLAARRGTAIASGACAIALAVTISACGAAKAAGSAGQARAKRAAGAARTSARTQGAGPREVVTDVIDQLSSRIAMVGIGAGPTVLNGRARLVLTTNFGRTFTSIGPRTAKLTEPDSVFFLDRDHGWFATFSVLNLAEKVYRTSDGGRTWRAFSAPGHNIAAGAQDSLQFVTPTKGFLMDTLPTAPAAALFRTSDGGATWHRVATMQPGRRGGAGVLPTLGRFEFEPGGTVGWLSNNLFASRLYRTTDGGRNWRPVRLPAPGGAIRGLPAVFGRTLVEPVTTGAGTKAASLRIYVSKDGGTTWSLVSSLPVGARPSCRNAPMPTSVVNPSAWWAADFSNHRAVAYRTADAGSHWSAFTTPAPAAAGFCGPDQIAAPSASRAWLVTPATAGGNETRIYATADGGRTWRRIDLAARAAR